MNDTPEIERQRALAGFVYRIMRGLTISPAQVRASLDAWNRLVLPRSSSSPATLPERGSEAYVLAFLDNMKKTGFMRLCHQ